MVDDVEDRGEVVSDPPGSAGVAADGLEELVGSEVTDRVDVVVGVLVGEPGLPPV